MERIKKIICKLKSMYQSFYNYVDWTYVMMIGVVLIGYVLLHDLIGETLLQHNVWDSYTLQAKRWLEGYMDLGQNYSYLEIAQYKGKFYVSFPPFPSVMMLPWVVVFGVNTPNNLIMIIYIIAALSMCYKIARYYGIRPEFSAFWSIVVVLGCNMLWMSTMGGVWFQAQLLNMILCLGAIYCMLTNRRTRSYICIALAVGCRPFSIVYFLVLFVYYYYKDYMMTKNEQLLEASNIDMNLKVKLAYNINNEKTKRGDQESLDTELVIVDADKKGNKDSIDSTYNNDGKLAVESDLDEKQSSANDIEDVSEENENITENETENENGVIMKHIGIALNQFSGIVAAAVIGMMYMIYNYARFDSLFEFGHNYLIEFLESKDGQFNASYILHNLYRIFIRGIKIKGNLGIDFPLFDGFWMYVANPIFIILFICIIKSIINNNKCKLVNEINPVKIAILIALVANLLCLCMHKTLGGWQFGNRYLVDLIPFAFIYILMTKKQMGSIKQLSRIEMFIGIIALMFNAYGVAFMYIEGLK